MTTLTLEDRKVLARAREVKARVQKARKLARPKPEKLKADRGRVRDNVYLQAVRRLPCVATLKRAGVLAYGCDACHVRASYAADGWVNPGLQVKPSDYRTVPLTRAEHTLQHSGSEVAYWKGLDIHPPALCKALHAAFPDHDAMVSVLRVFAGVGS